MWINTGVLFKWINTYCCKNGMTGEYTNFSTGCHLIILLLYSSEIIKTIIIVLKSQKTYMIDNEF